MDDHEPKIQKLKEYFEKRDDVMMAFLFGSQADERSHASSDWDIAVYIASENKRVEWEEHHKEYSQEDELWKDCTGILKTDRVDLIVLNRAPVNIADAAIRGMPLVIKDRGLFLQFMLIITKAAEDYFEFSKDYYDIFMRSASLVKRDADRLRNIIEFIEAQRTLYASFSGLSKATYEQDLIMRGAVERWVENIVNSVIDIAKIVLGSRRVPNPYGYANTVERAMELLALPKDVLIQFEKWVKLRNELAHEYLDIKWKRITDFITTSEPHIRSLLDATRDFLENEEKDIK